MATERREELIKQIKAAERAFIKAAQAVKGADLTWADCNLTMAQARTLFVLIDEGPSSIGRVAELQGISLPTASHLVDRLVQAGLLERTEDPDDRRRTLASASEAGAELAYRLRQRGEIFFQWLGQLDEDDLEALTQGLQAVARIATQQPALEVTASTK
ncbi:MAG TPA: MarR family transcriptional regulator [Thermomicrobiaceae bacterium]|nr:MarR family transcriptional regulator [Thermomicrobiaceae bacterium]